MKPHLILLCLISLCLPAVNAFAQEEYSYEYDHEYNYEFGTYGYQAEARMLDSLYLLEMLDSISSEEVRQDRDDFDKKRKEHWKRRPKKNKQQGAIIPAPSDASLTAGLMPTAVAANAVPDAVERAALVALYNATAGATSWLDRTNWLQGNTAADFATWFGIKIENGDVVEINLRQNKLSGSVPSQIGDLKALRYLNLGANQINVVSTRITELSVLEYLYLDKNSLTSLPSNIGNLSALVRLELNFNNIATLPTSIGQLKNLTALYMYANQLTSLPPQIGDMSSLENLFLYQNPLESLPIEIGKLTQLRGLFPKETLIKSIPAEVNQLVNLEYLNANNCQLEFLPPLTNLTKLKGIIVSNNRLRKMPNFSNHPNKANLTIGVDGNLIDLNLIAQNLTGSGTHSFPTFNYTPQGSPTDTITINDEAGTATLDPFPVKHPQSRYQWQRVTLGSSAWQNISGATNATYTVTGQTGKVLYRCRVTNNWLSGMTQFTSILILESATYTPPAPPTVSNAPDGSTVSDGSGSLANTIPRNTNSKVNYVRVYTPRTEITAPSDVTMSQSVANVSVSTEYLDGLGRPIQTVVRGGSGSASKDLVQPVAYDAYGRQVKQYLPYATSTATGAYRPDALYEQYQFYTTTGPSDIAKSDYAYSQTQFEASPLNRVQKQAAPGKSWRMGSGREVEMGYQVNTASEVRYWKASNSLSASVLSTSGYYGAGQLYKTVTTNENEHTTTEYRNKLDQVVLKRVQGPTGNQDTYYVYDDYQLLRFVLPPEASGQMNSNTALATNTGFIAQQLYVYHYDSRRNPSSEQVPGGGLTKLIYDKWNRMVLRQTALMREQNAQQWQYTKYDYLNRPIITGLYIETRTEAALRTAVKAATGRHENSTSSDPNYTLNLSFPTTAAIGTVRTLTYYDQYNFAHATQGSFNDGGIVRRSKVQGQVTGQRVRRLDNNGWLNSVTYYDEQQRPILQLTQNHKGGVDRLKTTYRNKVNDEVLATELKHNITGASRTIQQAYTYDHLGRLTRLTHKLDTDAAVTLSAQAYNALGELSTKSLNVTSSSAQQAINYRYNIRGWLTRINDISRTGSYFNEQLYYDEGFTKKSYNGNIAGVQWNRASGKAQAYGYLYDQASRITGADYRQKTTAGAWPTTSGGYSVDKVSYDKNGNIKQLKRYGERQERLYLWDDLTYTYTGNQLLAVQDKGQAETGFVDGASAATEYGYDGSGNLKSDANKAISSIRYDPILNLPLSVGFQSGSRIDYVYDALGTKLQQKVVPVDGSAMKTTDYVQGFHYENNQLAFVQHQEGRLTIKGSKAYHYDLKDHLGNTRVTFSNKAVTTTAMASMEMSMAQEEEAVFEGVAESRQTLAFHNTTDPSITEPTPNQVATLMPGEQGPSKSLQVHQGDTIRLKVDARYETKPASAPGIEGVATEIAGALQKTASGLESGAVSQGLNGATLGSVALSGEAQEVPEAHLNYLLFDEDYKLVDQGFVSVSEAAAVGAKNPNAAPEQLSLEVPVAEDGFLYAYLSNEAGAGAGGSPASSSGLAANNIVPANGPVANNGTPVYFDDFTVEQQSFIVQVDDFYPFGLTHQQPLPGQLKNRYLYNGKELTQDFGLGWYDYGFRMYDPAVGRFTGVDPIADEFAHVSTYNYAENEPIANIDLWGLQKVSIHTNSFAPFNTFGGPYRGDGTNRGFQANAGASTRIGAQINIDASSTGVSLVGDPQAIGSESHNTLTGSSTFSEAAFESFSLKDGTLNFHVSGNNDLVPGSSDIDTKGNIGISRTDLGEEGSVINFSGTISGDKFPANETFVTDQAGTGVFLGVSGADGNPFTSLPGDNNRKMSSFNIGVQFNSNGNIQGIQYNGQTYSVTDWKKQFQGLNPQSGNVSTTY